MTLLAIVHYPDPRLKTITKPVTVFDEQLKTLIHNMYETMYANAGVGLASTQVGLDMQLFTMDCTDEGKSPRCFINAEILEKSGIHNSEEGCLSVPGEGLYAKVERAATVTIRYVTEDNVSKTETFSGLEAKCVQHEIDHLQGKLYVDCLKPFKRQLVLQKYTKQKKVPL